MKSQLCYFCRRQDNAHAPGCPQRTSKKTPVGERLDFGGNIGEVDVDGETVAKFFPDLKPSRHAKPLTPAQAVEAWQRRLKPTSQLNVLRGALPIGTAYRVNSQEPYLQERLAASLEWTPILPQGEVIIVGQPDVEFRADTLIIMSDAAPKEILVTAILFGACHQLLSFGTLPIEAFPLIAPHACEVCGNKSKPDLRVSNLTFPTVNPAQRISVHFRNEGIYHRNLKCWLEGEYTI